MLTNDQLRSLPMWVAVGFAAHCARLVLPAFRDGYPTVSSEILGQLERAVSVAEEFASRGSGAAEYAAEADGDLAVDIAVAVRRWANDPVVENYSDAAAGAAYAAGAAADLTAARPWGNRELVYSNVERAVKGACQNQDVSARVEADYARLFARVQAAGLDDASSYPGTPI